MQKLNFLNLSLLLFLSLSVSAQSVKLDKESWQIFQPKGEEFTVKTSTLLEPFVYSEDVSARRFTAQINGRFLFISSDLLAEPFHYKKVQDLLKQAVFKSKKEKLNNFEVEKISFDYSDDFFHKMWIIKTEQRIYIFHTASEIENDGVVEKFFNSIQVNRQLIDDNKETELVFRQGIGTSGSNSNSYQKAPLGIASDTGTSSNSGSSANSPKQDSDNSPLQIFSKPRANYDFFARFFDIQGSINVRTTFLNTGEIGTIVAVTKLPFGLTKSALEAAQKLKFKPKKVAGADVSVTKTVQYTFTIY